MGRLDEAVRRNRVWRYWRDDLRRRLRAGSIEAKRSAGSVARRQFVVDTFPVGSCGAEIGVWRGDFSASILERVRPKHLYLIDPWRHLADPGFESSRFSGGAARDQRRMDRVCEKVQARLAEPIAAGTVTIMRMTSDEALGQIPDRSLDWIYIDGNHRYEFVARELQRACVLVRPGGIIAGDDYANEGWWEDGVTVAVDELAVATGTVEPIVFRNHQFVLRLR